MQANWQSYLRWTWQILRDLRALQLQLGAAQDAQREAGQRVTGLRLRNLLFPLVPVASYTAHHAHFDQLGFEVDQFCPWPRRFFCRTQALLSYLQLAYWSPP